MIHRLYKTEMVPDTNMHVRGVILVITSCGEDYAKMEAAWLISWARQYRDGLRLLFLQHGSSAHMISLPVPAADRLICQGEESLIPGVLDKTGVGLQYVHTTWPAAWAFRTNLSSHVDLKVLDDMMSTEPDRPRAIGYSPGRDHMSGAGFGLTPKALHVLLDKWPSLNRALIDDVAISEILFRNCELVFTGRLDRVWPDGIVKHGYCVYHYHVRVKTRDRNADAAVLLALSENGIGVALDWYD